MGEGKVLEVIADIAIAGDLKGSLVAGLHGGLAGTNIGLVLRDRVEVGIKAGHAKLRDRVVLNRSGAVRGAVDRKDKIIVGDEALKIGVRRIRRHQLGKFHAVRSPFWK